MDKDKETQKWWTSYFKELPNPPPAIKTPKQQNWQTIHWSYKGGRCRISHPEEQCWYPNRKQQGSQWTRNVIYNLIRNICEQEWLSDEWSKTVACHIHDKMCIMTTAKLHKHLECALRPWQKYSNVRLVCILTKQLANTRVGPGLDN